MVCGGRTDERVRMTDTSSTSGHPPSSPENRNADSAQATIEPGIIVAGMPHLLGFHPEESLIAVALSHDPEHPVVATVRIDLPDLDDKEDQDAVVEVLTDPLAQMASRSDAMLLIAWSYSDGDRYISLIETLAHRAAETGAVVRDALIVRSGHNAADTSTITWRSVRCGEESSHRGHENRVTSAHRRIAAQRLARPGRQPVSSRIALETELVPVQPRADWVGPTGTIPPNAIDVAAIHAVTVLRGLMAATPTDSALLAHALTDARVRDIVIWEILTYPAADWERVVLVMVAMVRTCPEPVLPPIATCLGILHWQLGDGVRAMIAIEHALRVDPDYSLAQLIGGCISHGVHPADWRRDLLTLQRGDLAGS